LLFPDRGQDKLLGEMVPAFEELFAPGGSPLEAFSEQMAAGKTSAIGELYNDFDYALVSGPGMFS